MYILYIFHNDLIKMPSYGKNLWIIIKLGEQKWPNNALLKRPQQEKI